MKKTIILSLLIFSVLFLKSPKIFSQQRGVTLLNITIDNKETSLYKESHALVIGVYDYSNGWADLAGVKDDIAAVKDGLEKQDFDVTMVENPTKDGLDKAFGDFISKYGQGAENRLLIYFAGHGHTLKTSYGDELGYIVLADAPDPNTNQAGFQTKSMEMAQIEIYAKRIQSKHALFLFDACFSGSLFALSRAAPAAISYKTVNPVRQFITSGSASETVPDKSVFREQFLNALTTDEADANKDGYLTGTELGEFLQTNVTNYTYNTQHPQYGKIRNNNLDKGDFVFILTKGKQDQKVVEQNNEQQIQRQNPIVEEKKIEEKKIEIIEATVDTYGSLELISELSGLIYLDGNFLKQLDAGKKISLNNIKTGNHTIELKGKENWSRTIKIEKDQTTKETIANKKQAVKEIEVVTEDVNTFGSIELSSEISGLLYLDGKFMKQIDAGKKVNLNNIKTGSHTIEIKGKENWKQSVTVNHKQITKQKAEVNKEPQNGSEISDDLGYKFIYVKGGTFSMGCKLEKGSDCEGDESPEHSVTLSNYYIGKFEVTQKQWNSVMDINPKRPNNKDCDDCPKVNVSYTEIQEFIGKLNTKTGKTYRIPTEAEWEFAARGGSSSKNFKYSGSNSIEDVAWYVKNTSSKKGQIAGQKKPNELGVFDMTGNVSEWCADWFGKYSP
ncbi:MAG: SUMF1/EgtB/PvdO family nonheme iron enzyme, partial [Bacteroidetes bacterium]|nr:SUMF1/EgtB/PvdO family nonheme iron enzyme [Bacteroidota bacterium]